MFTEICNITDKLSTMGPRTQMAKVAIQSVYRLVLVHPSDHLLGMGGAALYVDTMLPFGLWSDTKYLMQQWQMQLSGCRRSTPLLRENATI